jgi:hypothetical protein
MGAKSDLKKNGTGPRAAVLNSPYRAKAQKLLNGRQLLFCNAMGQSARENREGFKRLVDLAAEFGGTHVHVGEIPFRYDNWVLPDNSDPYAAWCNHSPGILRVCPPSELHPWVSSEHAKKVQAWIRWQLDVMKPYGLKGSSYAVEPMWLPEDVYRAHPSWRGVQCELGRIAKRPYFAPNIDDAEVLDLYRRAMKEYSTRFPEVDHYRFMSNDSGGGIAWTPNVYPGINGPSSSRHLSGGERIAGWLAALKKGAAEAGVDMRFNIHSSGFPPELTASAQTKCEPGTFVREGNSHGETWGGPGAGVGGGLWSIQYPVIGVGSVPGFLSGLQSVYNSPKDPKGLAGINVHEDDLDLARLGLETFLDEPGTGSLAQTAGVLRAAERFCGSAKYAETLAGAWAAVDRAGISIRQIRQKGFGQVLAFCGVSMRWLTRPLVPEPAKLTAEELKFAAPFLFSTDPERDLRSFSYVLGKGVFRGESVAWMARWCLQETYDTLKGAERSVRGLAGQKDIPADAKDRLALLADRIGVYACLAANAKHVILYQYCVDTAGQPQFGPNPMDYDDNIIYDQRALTFRKLARAELDNINDLIEYIEKSKGLVIEHARKPSEESVFMLDTDLVAALRHKTTVMLNHWQDYETLYPATKVWDYDPPIIGNIV